MRQEPLLHRLRHDGIVLPAVLDGPIDGITFTAWIHAAPGPNA